ncbi:hypothetical protein IWQ60_003319 [Tieghemiomyces parasiticus]|uniref:RRM domain-containing protein n=1 Tax=Tieghemiomyces parasiticus TaxID=78921 RepID=A0A9W8ADG1_9FUNG|nr:hypothetical protein IWQ60_003319 [Tieghemiomyces parasiticus]
MLSHENPTLSRNGTVSFRDEHAATVALRLTGTTLGDRVIFVTSTAVSSDPNQPAAAEQQRIEELARTIYVGNLDDVIADDGLRALFEKFGNILFTRLTTRAGQTARFAFIEFENVQSAQAALSLSGTVYNERVLKVGHARSTIHKPTSGVGAATDSAASVQNSVQAVLERVREAQKRVALKYSGSVNPTPTSATFKDAPADIKLAESTPTFPRSRASSPRDGRRSHRDSDRARDDSHDRHRRSRRRRHPDYNDETRPDADDDDERYSRRRRSGRYSDRDHNGRDDRDRSDGHRESRRRSRSRESSAHHRSSRRSSHRHHHRSRRESRSRTPSVSSRHRRSRRHEEDRDGRERSTTSSRRHRTREASSTGQMSSRRPTVDDLKAEGLVKAQPVDEAVDDKGKLTDSSE